jgi:GNAT superfamily N-acetyltransferase
MSGGAGMTRQLGLTSILQPWASEDVDALFDIHRRSAGPYVDELWGWDDVDQRRRFRDSLSSRRQKIVIDGRVVGLLDVSRTDEVVMIAGIELVPEMQGRGLGTSILEAVIADARERGTPVTLQVFEIYARTHRLYESLGFVATAKPTCITRWNTDTGRHPSVELRLSSLTFHPQKDNQRESPRSGPAPGALRRVTVTVRKSDPFLSLSQPDTEAGPCTTLVRSTTRCWNMIGGAAHRPVPDPSRRISPR